MTLTDVSIIFIYFYLYRGVCKGLRTNTWCLSILKWVEVRVKALWYRVWLSARVCSAVEARLRAKQQPDRRRWWRWWCLSWHHLSRLKNESIRKEGGGKNKIVESQLKACAFEAKVDIRGILLGRLNDVDDTESLLSPICWAPLYWAPLCWAV